jgi:hypothetical protein
MGNDEPMRINMSELPKLLELIGPNGETKLFELLPSKKDGFGVFTNKVSKTLRKYIVRNK